LFAECTCDGKGEVRILLFEKKAVSGILFTFLLVSMFVLASNIQSVKASGTIYIRADGSIDPPTAPISTLDNVTYTLTGNITSDTDGIVVEGDNIVVDGAGHCIQGTGIGINLEGRSNVTIRNTNIKNSGYGIWLEGSSNNSIVGNKITNNSYGIDLYMWAQNNSIVGNSMTDNQLGIWLEWWSNYNSIVGNVFVNDGLAAWDFYGNVVIDNLVNGKPLVYLENVSDVEVEDAGQVLLVNCTRIRVENLNLSNTAAGVQVWRTSHSTIAGNNITNNRRDGIRLRDSSNNSIVGNNIIGNSADGIRLHGSSDHNSITGNIMTSNGEGITLEDSTNNNISQNNITACTGYYFAIKLAYSSNNSIFENSIANNGWGIGLDDASNNSFCHNNFINNTVEVYDWESGARYANLWDNGCEGNFWSDYNGVDLDNDGVGDTYLPWEGVDDYPLMNVYWNPCDINHDLKVDMRDIGISAKAFGTVPGDTFWNPHADITGPELLVPDGKVDMRDISLVARHFGRHF
jgi:parallel beta-helix repeat protein